MLTVVGDRIEIELPIKLAGRKPADVLHPKYAVGGEFRRESGEKVVVEAIKIHTDYVLIRMRETA